MEVEMSLTHPGITGIITNLIGHELVRVFHPNYRTSLVRLPGTPVETSQYQQEI